MKPAGGRNGPNAHDPVTAPAPARASAPDDNECRAVRPLCDAQACGNQVRQPGVRRSDWKEAHNKSHKQVRARVEHVFARMKTWKILRDCRLKGDGVHHDMLGIARLHNLALTG